MAITFNTTDEQEVKLILSLLIIDDAFDLFADIGVLVEDKTTGAALVTDADRATVIAASDNQIAGATANGRVTDAAKQVFRRYVTQYQMAGVIQSAIAHRIEYQQTLSSNPLADGLEGS